MRIKVLLDHTKGNLHLPFNYQYSLAAAVYKIIYKVAPAYGQFLHDKGYSAPSGRLMKLFTFSKLIVPDSYITKSGITTNNKSPWILYISSPMLQDFIKSFIKGVLENSVIELNMKSTYLKLRVCEIDIIHEPAITSPMYFKTLSPIVLSTVIERNGKKAIYYYRPTDEAISSAIEKNLREKLAIVNPKITPNGEFKFELDREYIKRKTVNKKRLTKKITIKPGTPQATEIIGFESPFQITCDPELLRIAWECGIGEHTSQGFGMIEIIDQYHI